MTNVHLLIETGRASRLAACDEPFANGQPGSEILSEVTCPSCSGMFAPTSPVSPVSTGSAVSVPVIGIDPGSDSTGIVAHSPA